MQIHRLAPSRALLDTSITEVKPARYQGAAMVPPELPRGSPFSYLPPPSAPTRADFRGPGPVQTEDAALFAEMKTRAGDAGFLEARRVAVAQQGGWPIQVSPGRYAFAFVDEGNGPYHLETSATGWGQPIPLQRQGKLLFAEVDLSDAQAIGCGYKLVDGQGGYAADPLSRRYRYDDNGAMSLVRAPGDHLERFPLSSGNPFQRRFVRVRVPPGNVTHQLYAHDGQNCFDPGSMWGGWRLHEAAGDHTMVIAIDNDGMGRMDDYVPFRFRLPVEGAPEAGGKGDDYVKLIDDRVVPFVENTYGVASRRGMIGSSLGGIATLHHVGRSRHRWDFAAALSPSTWLEDTQGAPVNDRLAALSSSSTTIGLYSGGGDRFDGGRADSFATTRSLKERLEAAGKPVFYAHREGARHNEAAWAEVAPSFVRLFESR